MARLFVSVRPPVPVLDALAARLAPWPELVRTRDRWHLTVRFLGDTAMVGAVVPALRGLATERAFTARLAGAATFGSGRRPRTLWVGVDVGADGFVRLADSVSRVLGLDAEEHVPHLTLRRLAAPQARIVVDGLGRDPIGPAFTVDALLLEESSFPRQPVEYRVVTRVPLRDNTASASAR